MGSLLLALDGSFDAVIISNALHIIPDPEKTLSEIDRVLRPGGVLIAPNFVEHKGTAVSRIWSGTARSLTIGIWSRLTDMRWSVWS